MAANDGWTVLRQTLTSEFGLELGSQTIADVKRTVAEIQDKQVGALELRDMSRIRIFLDRLENLQAELVRNDSESCAHLGLVWLSIKCVLETASAHPLSFGELLEAFKNLGHALPVFDSPTTYTPNYAFLNRLLGLILDEVLHFLLTVMSLVSYYFWRRMFLPLWTEFKYSHQIHILDRIRKFAKVLNDRSTQGGIKVDLDSLLTDLQYDEAQRIRDDQSRRDTMMEQVRGWLNAKSQDDLHEALVNIYNESPASGQWLLERKQVREWCYDEMPLTPILWIHAIPGAGKTVLTSRIIYECQQQKQSHTAYFYCTHDDHEARRPLAIYRAILFQIIHQFPYLSAYFDHERRQQYGTHLVSEKRAQQLLETLVHLSSRQYIIFDGLDECELKDRKTVLKFLISLVQNVDRVKPGCLRLLITSRNEPDIQQYMNVGYSLALTADDNKADIRYYITMWVDSIQEKFGISDRAADLLKKRIYLQTNGQFLFAKLLLRHLFDQPDRKCLAREIEHEKLPEGLPQMYDRILARIQQTLTPSEWISARRFLGWITCARRPLKWRELQGAMSIDLDEMVVDYEERQSRHHVRELCGSLVYERADCVRLVHSTAKRYIIESQYIDIARVNCQLTRLCLLYLTFDCFFDYQPNTGSNEYLLDGYFAFTEYAAVEWPGHLENIFTRRPQLEDSFDDLLKSDDFLGVCEAATEVVLRHTKDFPPDPEQSLPNNANVLPQPIQVKLSQHNPDHVDSFKALWSHMMVHRYTFSTDSRQISLLSVEDTVILQRKAIENLISLKTTPELIRDGLKRKYGSKLYKCSKAACYYFYEGFTDQSSRDRHVKLHDRRFQCHEPECTLREFGFANESDLRRHQELFHPDADIKMTLYNELKPKMIKGRKWQCPRCDKSFVRNGILKSHLLSHEGKRPFECLYCGQAFTRKYDCKRHEKGHDNESTQIAKRARLQDIHYDRIEIIGDNGHVDVRTATSTAFLANSDLQRFKEENEPPRADGTDATHDTGRYTNQLRTSPTAPLLVHNLSETAVMSGMDTSDSGFDSDTSLDSDSWPDWELPGTFYSAKKLEIVQDLMQLFDLHYSQHRKFITRRSEAGLFTSAAQSGADNPSSSAASGSCANPENERPSKANGKRRRTDSQGEDDDYENGREGDGKRQKEFLSDGLKYPDDDVRLFACPFYKRDRLKHRACRKMILKKVSRVKLHLKRNHQQPIHCDRCSKTFENKAERTSHLRMDVLCEVTPPVHWDAVTKEQKKELSRRSCSKQSECQQWYTIYEILFPSDKRPDSPFLDQPDSLELCQILAFAETEGRPVVDSIIAGLPEGSRLSQDDTAAFMHSVCQEFITRLFERWESRDSDVPPSHDALYPSASMDGFQSNRDQREASSGELEIQDDGNIERETVLDNSETRADVSYLPTTALAFDYGTPAVTDWPQELLDELVFQPPTPSD